MPRNSAEYNKARSAYYAYYNMTPEIPWEALGQVWQLRWKNVVRTIDCYERRAPRADKGVPRPHVRKPRGPYKSRKPPSGE